MKIKPFNRYLLVTPIEEEGEKKDLAIVLPTDYKKPTNPYLKCRVNDISSESKFYDDVIKIDDTVIVERRMLNKIEFDGKTSYLVLENYIYGSISNETK